LDCGTYIQNFLSAHVDGELSRDELRAAEEHLAACPTDCLRRLEDERALKHALHEHFAQVRVPSQVRVRIDHVLATIQEEDLRESRAGRIPSATPSFRPRWFGPRFWAPTAIAALLIVGLIGWRIASTPSSEEVAQEEGSPQPGAIPMFELAAHHLDNFDKGFKANVPSDSARDISDAYLSHKMPGYLWNFGPMGYQLVGGRLEELQNGQMAAFTYYHGERGGILCTYMHLSGVMPAGAIHENESHAYYSYKGYSICLSKYPRGDFICLLISRRPMPEFMETINSSQL
jgi:anti-sigma factor RsiW